MSSVADTVRELVAIHYGTPALEPGVVASAVLSGSGIELSHVPGIALGTAHTTTANESNAVVAAQATRPERLWP